MVDDAEAPRVRLDERSYSSFLIRCWRLSDGRQRIKVQHIQSGQWSRVATLAAAIEWIDGQCEVQKER